MDRDDEVDALLGRLLLPQDDALAAVLSASAEAGLPQIEVSAVQARLLELLARIGGARRILEVGTLGGYSTIHLVRGAGPDGRVVTLEMDPHHAAVARANLARAGVAERVEVVEGPASASLDALVAAGAEPFDLVFIDADKQSNPAYVRAALALSRTGTVIVIDNVVRGGRILDAGSPAPDVVGTLSALELLGSHPRLAATALQTVGSKGWDGLAIAVVTS